MPKPKGLSHILVTCQKCKLNVTRKGLASNVKNSRSANHQLRWWTLKFHYPILIYGATLVHMKHHSHDNTSTWWNNRMTYLHDDSKAWRTDAWGIFAWKSLHDFFTWTIATWLFFCMECINMNIVYCILLLNVSIRVQFENFITPPESSILDFIHN